ncbi:MAG: hypothetical protein IJR86_05535 [Bacteroidaceae bacterium]|nr:hypothetical protein [Bacteroidaceae bacterium]
MEFERIYWEEIGASAEVTHFHADNGTDELHAIIHIEPNEDVFAQQLKRIYKAEELLASHPRFKNAGVVFKRYFLSDSTNQAPLIGNYNDSNVSIIQQPPLDGSKIAVWIYYQKNTLIYNENGMTVAEHNGYKHLWKLGMLESKGDSAWQTECLLINYEEMLLSFDATFADNCIRTWFYVRDVDTQYAGMVKARKENFIEQGLTEKTHYIASTGIGGLPENTKALVQLGAYSLVGFEPAQQRYLYAPTHLNPTYEYGVTFERGTLMEYGDRGHIFISGTASINNKGEVMYVGDIVNQTRRMWENVETLLAEGGMAFDDVMQIIVYLRDMADYKIVSKMFKEKFPNTPYIITLAPVCRPTWLIEMECIAVDKRKTNFKEF